MATRSNWANHALTIGVALLLVLGAAPRATAVDIESSSLPVSQAPGYLGEWVLTVDAPDNPFHLILTFLNVGGKLGATLQSSAQPQPQVITDITQSSLALKLRYAAQFGETETSMVLIVRLLERGTLTGSLADETGLLLAEDVPTEHQTLGLGLFAARVRGEKGGKIPGRATLALSGKDLKVTFGGLRVGSADYKRLASMDDGAVFEFTGSRATKLFTESDLQFGDVVIKAENAAPNYPGVYSLWLKKVGDGWHLVFNEEADIWGTQHDPAADVAEVPLTLAKADQAQSTFLVGLEEQGNSGVLRLSWGSDQWTTNFSLVH